ncbi:hypothetical protein V1512DRAFT_259984 [Lipomyces arxii]|uniref:uncharacterized protein n=1 Tax=Lipomyces arxii TaxID=56418 RepID=UPI0034CF8789
MAQTLSSSIASKAFYYDSVFGLIDKKVENKLQQNPEDAREVVEDWHTVTSWMTPRSLLHLPGDEVYFALSRMKRDGMPDRLLDWYIDAVRSHFAVHAIPALKNPIAHAGSLAAADTVSAVMQSSLSTLCDALKHYMYPVSFVFPDGTNAIDGPGQIRFRNSLNAMIDIALSDYDFQLMAHMFVGQQLASCCEYDDVVMTGADNSLLLSIRERIDVLELQNLMNRIVAESYHSFIQRYVIEKYSRKWDGEDSEATLAGLKAVVHGSILQCVEIFIGKNENLGEQLFGLASECLVKLRIEEMFDMVIFFPDSISGLEDFKALLKAQEHRAYLVKCFQNSCQQRLLHCGANTADIISFYFSAIKVLKILEPRGVLLDRISRPIRRYLRERDDTVKCIVNGMLEVEGGIGGDLTELSKELASVSGAQAEAAADDSDFFDMNWVPDPVDAAPDFRSKRSLDFIGSFLSLYENKEVFVKEITVVFANQLLESTYYQIDKSLMDLELLKLRFGEAELHSCDVMVKDIAESKRVDINVHDAINNAAGKKAVMGFMHASVLSQLFWPSLRDEELVLPKVINSQLQYYADRFSILKSGRKLKWLKRLGTVEVTLELEDRTLEFNVSPERASLIYLFQKKGSNTLLELANELRIDEIAAKKAILFWIGSGVLAEDENEKDRYFVLEHANEGPNRVVITDTGASVQTTEEKATEQMRIYWSYIVGMLTNLQSLPIDRIQSFLKMLIPKDMGYSRTTDELRDFLTVMISEDKLELSGGNYRLKK